MAAKDVEQGVAEKKAEADFKYAKALTMDLPPIITSWNQGSWRRIGHQIEIQYDHKSDRTVLTVEEWKAKRYDGDKYPGGIVETLRGVPGNPVQDRINHLQKSNALTEGQRMELNYLIDLRWNNSKPSTEKY